MAIKDFLKRLNPIANFQSQIINYRKEIDELKKSSMAAYRPTILFGAAQQGEDFKVDPKLILQYALTDNYISAAVRKKVNKVLSGGYLIEPKKDMPEADMQLKDFEDFEKIAGGSLFTHGKQKNLLYVLRRLVHSVIIGDDFYLELELPHDEKGMPIITERPRALHILDWEDMKINQLPDGTLAPLKINEYGKRIDGAYLQFWGGELKTIFSTFQIIHDNYYGMGTRAYGNSLIRSVLWAASSKQFAEKFSSAIFSRQRPNYLWEITADDIEFEKTKQQIKEAGNQPGGDLFTQTPPSSLGETQPAIKVTQLTKPEDLAYKEFIDTARKDIIVGLGVPGGSLFAPIAKSGWEAQTELHEFDEDINGIRDFLERIINDQLFPR